MGGCLSTARVQKSEDDFQGLVLSFDLAEVGCLSFLPLPWLRSFLLRRLSFFPPHSQSVGIMG